MMHQMIFRGHKERDCFSRNTRNALATVVASLLLVSTAPAAVRELVRMAADLNTTAKSSSPAGLTVINDELFFHNSMPCVPSLSCRYR